MTPSRGTIDDVCINTIRTLSIEAVEQAASVEFSVDEVVEVRAGEKGKEKGEAGP